MSSLPGEEALKEPLAFEVTWSVRHLVDLLEEKAEWLRLGGLPGDSGVDLQISRSSGMASLNTIKSREVRPAAIIGRFQWCQTINRYCIAKNRQICESHSIT